MFNDILSEAKCKSNKTVAPGRKKNLAVDSRIVFLTVKSMNSLQLNINSFFRTRQLNKVILKFSTWGKQALLKNNILN